MIYIDHTKLVRTNLYLTKKPPAQFPVQFAMQRKIILKPRILHLIDQGSNTWYRLFKQKQLVPAGCPSHLSSVP